MPISRKILFLGLLVVPVVSTAHHAVAGRYDPTKTIEVEGVVTSLLWRNPHVQVSMRVIGENEIAQDWSMATTSLSNMRRWQIGSDFIEVGDAIRVAGNPARSTAAYGEEILEMQIDAAVRQIRVLRETSRR